MAGGTVFNNSKSKFSENYINTIPSNTFQGLNKLERVYLRNNIISSIDANAFSMLPALKSIYLEDNSIYHLRRDWVAGEQRNF